MTRYLTKGCCADGLSACPGPALAPVATTARNRVDLPELLRIGSKFQKETGWIPPTVLAKRQKEQEEAAEEKTESTEVGVAAEGGEG